MTPLRKIAAATFAIVAALVIAGLSRVPVSPLEASQPLVRLSWRILGVRVEECRSRTAEELASLAPHMRTAEVCTGGIADYGLRVRVDGEEIVEDTVRPSGARRDRPVYVLRDLPVAPGRHRVQVGFTALVPPTSEVGDQPIEFGWEGDIELDVGEIALITMAPSGRAPRASHALSSLYVPTVVLHVLAAMLWIGGMLFFALAAPVLRQVGDDRTRATLFATLGRRFRFVGWICLALLLGTGVVQLNLRGWWGPGFWNRSILFGTPLGLVLVWKLGLVSLMLGIQAVHDFWLGPRASSVTPGSGEARRLRARAAGLARLNALVAIALVYVAVRLARGS